MNSKPTPSVVLVAFGIAVVVMLVVFCLVGRPVLLWDSGDVQGFFSGLGFLGMAIALWYQAQWNVADQLEKAEERRKQMRLEHDRVWFAVQFERLRYFTALRENGQKEENGQKDAESTMNQITDHWNRLSKELNSEIRNDSK